MTPAPHVMVLTLACLGLMVSACSTPSSQSSASTAPAPTISASATAPPSSADASLSSSSPSSSSDTTAPDNGCPAATDLPTEELIRQTLMVLVDGSASAADAYADLGGIFIQSGSSVDSSYTTLSLLDLPPIVAVDQEGGRVQGMRIHLSPMVSAFEQAQTLSVDEVRQLGASTGAELSALGVTMDFAPVADLYPGQSGGVIGDRGYSDDPEVVTDYVEAFGTGLLDAGITPTLKHFPGHGRASGDSHALLPVTPPLSELESADLVPYASILPRDGWAVMVGHLEVPGLTAKDSPASLDPAAYSYLRNELGFTGLIVTDELSGMRAVSEGRTTAETVVQALAAGADLALMANPGSIDDIISAVKDALDSGELTRERLLDAAGHVLAVKTCSGGNQ